MESRHIFRRRVLAILRAGIFGAAIFDGSLFALNLVADLSKPGQLRDGITLIGYFVAAPVLLITSALGLQTTVLAGYLINGLVGATAFAFVSAIRRFVFWDDDEE